MRLAASMSLQRVLAMQLQRAVYNPCADGHRCGFCRRDAKLAFRVNTSAPALWQLLTIPTVYACWDHYPYAVARAKNTAPRRRSAA
jgi:hypothetical protein